MTIKLGTAVAVVCLGLASCATAPALIPIETSRAIPLSKDEVWSNLVEHFATSNLAIKTIEKDSGIIYAERMFSSVNDLREFADCGGATFMAPVGGAVDLNVFVRETPSGVNATVNARFRQTRASIGGNVGVAECVSLGNLERGILNAAAGR